MIFVLNVVLSIFAFKKGWRVGPAIALFFSFIATANISESSRDYENLGMLMWMAGIATVAMFVMAVSKKETN